MKDLKGEMNMNDRDDDDVTVGVVMMTKMNMRKGESGV